MKIHRNGNKKSNGTIYSNNEKALGLYKPFGSFPLILCFCAKTIACCLLFSSIASADAPQDIYTYQSITLLEQKWVQRVVEDPKGESYSINPVMAVALDNSRLMILFMLCASEREGLCFELSVPVGIVLQKRQDEVTFNDILDTSNEMVNMIAQVQVVSKTKAYAVLEHQCAGSAQTTLYVYDLKNSQRWEMLSTIPKPTLADPPYCAIHSRLYITPPDMFSEYMVSGNEYYLLASHDGGHTWIEGKAPLDKLPATPNGNVQEQEPINSLPLEINSMTKEVSWRISRANADNNPTLCIRRKHLNGQKASWEFVTNIPCTITPSK